MVEIRLANRADLPAIVAIYNAAIPGHQATTDLTEVSVEDREPWFGAHDPERRPLWVAVSDADEVIGWLSFSTFYDRPAWDPTVEVSYYVHPARQRQGVGRALLNHALAAAPALGISSVMALVAGHNDASIGLLASAGFHQWGHLPRVVQMPEGPRDILILGRSV